MISFRASAMPMFIADAAVTEARNILALCDEAKRRDAASDKAHDPDDAGAEAAGGRVHDAAKALVRFGFAAVREISGENNGFGSAPRSLQLGENLPEVRLAVYLAVKLVASGKQVRVADVKYEVIRPGVLSRSRGHNPSNRVWRWCSSVTPYSY